MSYDGRMTDDQLKKEREMIQQNQLKRLREQMKEAAVKADQGKPEMSLLPMSALNEVAKVLSFGKSKYGAHNWRNGFEWTRLSSALLRHTCAWIDCDDTDDESGLNHIAHAACCALFLLEHQLKNYGTDDRHGKD